VLLFVPMSIELYVVLLAVHHLGACAVFVDAWAGRSRLDQAVRAARPRAFIGSPRAHLLRVASPALRAIPRAIVVGGPWPLARIAEPGAALEDALVLARELAALPQLCLRSDRVSSYEQWALSLDDALSNEFARGAATIASGETLEGAARFAAGAGRHGAPASENAT